MCLWSPTRFIDSPPQTDQNAKEFDDHADLLLIGWGILNKWNWPEVRGIHDFKGSYWHSAAYDNTYDPKGKRIAVIGAGSSGIQIVPALAKVAGHVDHYNRSTTWLAPMGYGADELIRSGKIDHGNFEYGAEEMEQWKKDPISLHRYRLMIEDELNRFLSPEGLIMGSVEERQRKELFTAWMADKLKDQPEILDAILPSFPPGCKRLTPAPGYLEALKKPHVGYISTKISHVTETGIVTEDGEERLYDAIIWATGFDTDYKERFPIVGEAGITWNQVMSPEPESYLGMTVDKMPNLFLYLGPNAAPGGTNAVATLDLQCQYTISFAKKMLLQKYKSFVIKPERVKQFTSYVTEFHKRTIFGQPCSSYLKRNIEDGRNVLYCCGNAQNLVGALQNPRWEDYEWTGLDELGANPMAWLGNGFSLSDYGVGSRVKYLQLDEIDPPPVPADEKGEEELVEQKDLAGSVGFAGY